MLCLRNHDFNLQSSQWRAWILRGMGFAALLLCRIAASHAAGTDPRIAATEIVGTVTSAHGAEAGVWVIAETRDFKTRYAKIVVTDAAGRYLIPELPAAKYRV